MTNTEIYTYGKFVNKLSGNGEGVDGIVADAESIWDADYVLRSNNDIIDYTIKGAARAYCNSDQSKAMARTAPGVYLFDNPVSILNISSSYIETRIDTTVGDAYTIGDEIYINTGSGWQTLTSLLEAVNAGATQETINHDTRAWLVETNARISVSNNLLNDEITAREKADSNLQDALNSEIAARQNGDNTLEKNLNQEIADRHQADEDYKAQITTAYTAAVEGEKQARQAADNDIWSALRSEIASRISGDSNLQKKLDTEANTRATADEKLANKISESVEAEKNRATAAENVNKAAIAIINGDSSTVGSIRYYIAQLINNAPEELDTLKEIADRLKDEENVGSSLISQIAELETRLANHITDCKNTYLPITTFNSFKDTEYKNTTDSLARLWVLVNQLKTNVETIQSDLSNYALKTDIPTNVSAFTNDAGYLTSADLSKYITEEEAYALIAQLIKEAQENVSNTTNASVALSTTYTTTDATVKTVITDSASNSVEGSGTISAATESQAGLLSADDKKALDSAVSKINALDGVDSVSVLYQESSPGADSNTVTVSVTSGSETKSGSTTIPLAAFVDDGSSSNDHNGLMSAFDKQKLDILANALLDDGNRLKTEEWTFTLEDGSTVTKNVFVK